VACSTELECSTQPIPVFSRTFFLPPPRYKKLLTVHIGSNMPDFSCSLASACVSWWWIDSFNHRNCVRAIGLVHSRGRRRVNSPCHLGLLHSNRFPSTLLLHWRSCC
jgi:hypothetical protein